MHRGFERIGVSRRSGAVIVTSRLMRKVGDGPATSDKLDNPAAVASSPVTK